MKNMAKPARLQTPAEQAFIVTVGVSQDRYLSDCSRVLSILKRYGFECGATKHDTFDLVAADKNILPQLREIQPSDEGLEHDTDTRD